MASVAAGVTAYDTVYPDIKNVDGLRAEANDARRMGYGGKIAIHPDQVAIIHEVFTPSAQESRLGQARRRHLRKQSRLRRADARRQDARQAAPRAGAAPARPRGRMTDDGALLPTLDRLFAGPRESILTLDAFLDGLESRSYAFAIAALNAAELHPDRNSLAVDDNRRADGVPAGCSTSSADRCRRCRTSSAAAACRAAGCRVSSAAHAGTSNGSRTPIHARHEWWVTGMPRRLLQLAWCR